MWDYSPGRPSTAKIVSAASLPFGGEGRRVNNILPTLEGNNSSFRGKNISLFTPLGRIIVLSPTVFKETSNHLGFFLKPWSH